MFDYVTGVVVASALWVIYAVHLIVLLNSTLNRNLSQVGQRLSYMSQAATTLDWSERGESKSWKTTKYLFVIAARIPFLLLSWVYVSYAVGVFLWKRWIELTAPPDVKAARWRMKNLPMPFDMIVRELMKLTGEPPENYERFRTELIANIGERTGEEFKPLRVVA